MIPPVEAKAFNGLFPMNVNTNHGQSDIHSVFNLKGNPMHLSVQEDDAPWEATDGLGIAEGGKS